MGGSDREEFNDARLNADPDFAIYQFGAAHSRYLDPNRVGRISGSFRMITSDERLAPSKMTTFGGLYSVRGYEEDEIVADGGILISGQYEFDLLKLNEPTEGSDDDSQEDQRDIPWLRKLAPLVFVDYGRAKIKSAVAGERSVQKLVSVGVGLAVELRDDFTGAVYYGYPLRSTAETDKGEGRFNISVTKRF